ncbi:M3 family oligoendopeptidase [Exiguobacterium sp.]|uniref:M3 family oligoendopeptidase n=1 Tax=Exiguobacterium sp. TaxID=44751 RepID=UPI00391DC18D
MDPNSYVKNWNLDCIFKGGSSSSDLLYLINKTTDQLKEAKRTQESLTLDAQLNEQTIEKLLNSLGTIQLAISQMKSFVYCLTAESPQNQGALVLQERITVLHTEFSTLQQHFQFFLSTFDQTVWDEFLENKCVKQYRCLLKDWRHKTKSNLSKVEEQLISDLMYDGYSGWSDLYFTLLNSLTLSLEVDGTNQLFSIGQATNLRSHPDPNVRETSFLALELLWEAQENIMARILNHITGFRIQLDQHRNLSNCLEKPLKDNRIKQETLNAMWSVVATHKQSFASYLNYKASLSGKSQMASYDFWAPFHTHQSIPYTEAVDFIINRFQQFGPEMARFAHNAFEKGWIEAENRPGKSAVAFCAGFPLSGESRIFLTYEGTMTNVLTLAHELGHAFHNHTMMEVEPLSRQYGMVMAETASTFAEMIVLDAAIDQVEHIDEKLFLLDEKIKRSVMNFMNLHARFLFEEKLYEERKKGMVDAVRLNELMHDALVEGYDGALNHLPTHSWISTPHFYITSSPFYNFPYTIGYLFSVSLYAKAKETGQDFEASYVALLQDSGKMSVEDLAMKHLKEDITQQGFWEKGMKLCIGDVETFIELSSLSRTQ